MNRLANSVPLEVLKKLYLRIIPSFPVAPSGKRDTNPLLAEKVPEDSINCAEYLKTSRNDKEESKTIITLFSNVDNNTNKCYNRSIRQ